MSEMEPPLRSDAESCKRSSPPKFTHLPFIKLEEQDVKLPLHATYEASTARAMNAEQQPVAAQCLTDAVEIIKFESSTVSKGTASLTDMDKY
jgi:hypothetical protein